MRFWGINILKKGRQGTGLDFWMGNSFDGEEILQQIQKEEKFEISGINITKSHWLEKVAIEASQTSNGVFVLKNIQAAA